MSKDPFTSDAGGAATPASAAAFASTGLTTPDAVALQAAFRQFADGGLKACAIEASSIGIVEHRLAGTALSVAAFTNLTQDHLDYHGTMAAYGAAKRALFDMPGLKAAVLNVSDAQGRGSTSSACEAAWVRPSKYRQRWQRSKSEHAVSTQ